eukprot:scaffold10589_cov224-Chaetoceros_neogracile.AAC.2
MNYPSTIIDNTRDAIDHVRAHHNNDIRRPGAIGCSDSHNHLWYCFDCETNWKDHRCFNSHEAMLSHLVACHGKCIVHINEIVDKLDGSYCSPLLTVCPFLLEGQPYHRRVVVPAMMLLVKLVAGVGGGADTRLRSAASINVLANTNCMHRGGMPAGIQLNRCKYQSQIK